jgi:GntR family transcriptional regulator
LEGGSAEPLYQRLAGTLRAEIEAGGYPPGVALPSERKLMGRFSVTRATVRAAIGELRSEGLVVTERGSGAFVRRPPPLRRVPRNPGAPDSVEAGEDAPRGHDVEQVGLSEVAVDGTLGRRMQIPPGGRAIRWQRRHLAGGIPIELVTSYLPAGSVPGVEGTTWPPADDPHARLLGAQARAERYEDEVSARMPTPDERRRLEVPPGVPVLLVVRRAKDRAGLLVELSETVLAADRNALIYGLPASWAGPD